MSQRRTKGSKQTEQCENVQVKPTISPRKRPGDRWLSGCENLHCSPPKRVKDHASHLALPIASPLMSPVKALLLSPKRIPLSPRKDVSVNSPNPKINIAVRPLLQSPGQQRHVTPSSAKLAASPFKVRALTFSSPVKENTPIVGRDSKRGASTSQITKARGLNFDDARCTSPRKRATTVTPMSPVHLAKQQGEIKIGVSRSSYFAFLYIYMETVEYK